MALYNETYAIHGMVRDNSPKLPTNEYAFENFNIRFSTEGPNSKIVIKPEKGNKQISLMLYSDLDYTNRGIPLTELPFVILGACSLDKYIIVFGKQYGTNKDYIARLEKYVENDGNITFNCCYLFDGIIDLNFDFGHPIETHPYIETELQKKVYFCDGVNLVRCINVVNPQCINNLGLLDIGKHLALNERLTVTKKPGVFGSLPGGKLQVAFAYGTDMESMTSIIDYSALYDCVFENAGIDPAANPERAFADHTFEVRIDNLDSSYEWVFIYVILRSSLNAQPVVYVKICHIESSSLTYTIDLGERDILLSNRTIEDLIGYNSIIPLTIQPYENRMFAGNIKIINNQLPKFDENDVDSEFFLKTVGHETMRDHMYNYNPSDNVFSGSSYDNKGFRKHNWYKFGFIGQYENGEWTDVMCITTEQCDKHSAVELNNNDNTQLDIKNVKYGINFHVNNITRDKLMQLKNLGIKKLKPVCVYPTDSEKTIISQGIINPTIYRGKNRKTLNTTKLFAQPSWFFRPVKLFDVASTFDHPDQLYSDHSPYTMRKVSDLALSRNYASFISGITNIPYNFTMEEFSQQVNAGTVTGLYSNPEFLDMSSDLCHWNENFREFRHGMSLPTKDRINAECEFSEISGLDYAYDDGIEERFSKIETYCLSSLSPLNNDTASIFINNTYFNQSLFNYRDRDQSFGNFNWLRVARPNFVTNGYDNMIFIDTSICTFNSPEVDYYLIGGLGSSNINVSSPEYTMHLSGLAQINGSLSDIRIAPTTTIDNQQNVTEIEYLSGAETVQGTCITDTVLYDIAGVKDFLFRRNSFDNTQSPFCYTSGPFWFDKLLVLGFTDDSETEELTTIPIKENHIYTAFSDEVDTYFSSIYGLFSSSILNGDYLINEVLGFDPLSFSSETIKSLCYFYNGRNHRRLRRSSFKSVAQFVQTYYGEFNQRYDADNDDNKKRTILFTSGKILFGKYDMSDLASLLYTEDHEYHQSTSFGDYGAYYLTSNANYTCGNSLVERVTVFANFGNSLESFSDKSYFNLNYLDALDTSGNGWKNFFITDGLVSNHWSGNGINDVYAADIMSNNQSLGSNLCYFFGWWPLRNETFGNATNGKCDWWTYDALHLISMTFPYALPASNIVPSLVTPTRAISPSKYGSHLYGPFSTDFPNASFDPYYAHVVYPFMHNNMSIPFCGTSSIYQTASNSRPSYNYTASVLYSNRTKYLNDDVVFNTKNVFIKDDNEFLSIPYLGSNHSLQKYGVDDSDVITYNTVSLTAATKWYRGWRNVLGDGKDKALNKISKGWDKDNYEFSIFGNLVFSGYLPQLFTKSGRVTFGTNSQAVSNSDNYNSQVIGFRTGTSGLAQTCILNYISSPHIVFYSNNPNYIDTLIPSRAPLYNTSHKFNYYYKDYITSSSIQASFGLSNTHLNNDNSIPLKYINGNCGQIHLANFSKNASRNNYMDWYFPALAWACSNFIYPHTGNWVPITDEYNSGNIFEGSITFYPYWMRKNRVNNLPLKTTTYFVPNDSEIADQLRNSYNLCIADYVNTAFENTNPYTENIEFYSWSPCGESVLLDDILAGGRRYDLQFLEGDTYTTRYNCLKTVLPGNPVELQLQNGISECASVYIESYINLDGRYNSHEALYNDSNFSYIMNGTLDQVNKINPVYSQQNNLFSYFEKNSNYQATTIEHFPTLVQWSPINVVGSSFDSFGTFPSINSFYADGTQGAITKLIVSPSNKVISFQEKGISVLDINPQALLSTEASVIEINASDSVVLNRALYIDRTYGCQNKWTVTNAVDGIYFMDNHKKIIGKVSDNAVSHVSAMLGFESWAKDNLGVNNDVWEAGSYFDSISMVKDNTGFVSYYDPYYSDLYFINHDTCLSLNLPLSCFTSFYSYNKVPFIVHSIDCTYSFIVNDGGNTKMFRQYYTKDHTFFGNQIGYYVDILANPYPLYDKVYNFISYDNEVYNTSNVFMTRNGYNKLTVFNYAQQGSLDFNMQNTRIKFRTWRTEFPRESGTINRIRGTWCRVRLEHTDQGLLEDTNNLHNISINFSILEQPIAASSEDRDS